MIRTIDESLEDAQELDAASRLAYWEQVVALDLLTHPLWASQGAGWERLYEVWTRFKARALATRTQSELKAVHRELLAALEELR
jgi:hypothetical protein